MTESAVPHEPASRLDEKVQRVWAAHLAGNTLVALAIGLVAANPLTGALATLAWAVPLGLGLLAVIVVPPLRYRRWRWEVRDEEIDLRHGTFAVTRTLVPMRRVQHVDSSAGVLEQAAGVATVTVHTAGGEVAIPGLGERTARELHHRIAALARLSDG